MQTIASQTSSNNYRADVDGLRAIAVLSVILFHLNPAWASGGFVGVDLFFVISGYLITGQIRKDLSDGQFTVKNFYLRRIRRIVPPLVVMLITASCIALLILKPEDFRSFAYSLIVQPFSLQNLVFLAEGDYFRGADTKVLLHTWSLAVEEQFYLFWPLLLVLLKRLPFRPLCGALGIFIIASFYLCAVLTLSSPKTAFFLIFTRAWELGFGGLAAIWHENQQSANTNQQSTASSWTYETLGWFGIAGLGYAIFAIDSGIPFPGKTALIPVFAAFLLVLSGGSAQTTVRKILSLPILVKIGLISYPLYLWHWPLLVFMYHLHVKPTDASHFVLFWMATFVLASASYRWLEMPIRRKVWLTSPRSLLIGVAVSFAALWSFGLHVIVTDGAAYRFSEKERAFLVARIKSYTKRCDISARFLDPTSPICRHREHSADNRKILLWGNSHASMLIPMLKQLAEQNKASLYVNVRNCRPLVEPNACNAEVHAAILKKIKEKAINSVIFASSWGGLDSLTLEQQFTQTIRTLAQQNLTIWLVVDIPVGTELDPTTAIAKNPDDPRVGSVPMEIYNNGSRLKELEIFKRLQTQFGNIHIIDTSSVFCDQVNCFGGKGNDVWYRDLGHLNNAGVQAVSSFFLPVFEP